VDVRDGDHAGDAASIHDDQLMDTAPIHELPRARDGLPARDRDDRVRHDISQEH
jgi:hypothetical protein